MTVAIDSPPSEATITGTVSTEITDDRSGKKSPFVEHTDIILADTTYTYALPSEARGFDARMQSGTMKIRFTGSGDFWSVSAGAVYTVESISPDAGTITLFVQSSKDNDTLEVQSWS